MNFMTKIKIKKLELFLKKFFDYGKWNIILRKYNKTLVTYDSFVLSEYYGVIIKL